MSEGTTVRGADTFVATLDNAADDLRDMAPEAAGVVVRDVARARAPWDTGALRASLGVETANGRVSVGSPLVYAPVIHNGWAGHNIAANPFLIPPAEESAPVWGQAYVAETNRIMSTVRGA